MSSSSSSSSSKKFDLEERLVAYAGEISLFVEKLPKTYTCEYYGKQLTRSSGSIKELKESRVAIKIHKYVKVYDQKVLENILDETEQIIAILSKIVINKQNSSNSRR